MFIILHERRYKFPSQDAASKASASREGKLILSAREPKDKFILHSRLYYKLLGMENVGFFHRRLVYIGRLYHLWQKVSELPGSIQPNINNSSVSDSTKLPFVWLLPLMHR